MQHGTMNKTSRSTDSMPSLARKRESPNTLATIAADKRPRLLPPLSRPPSAGSTPTSFDYSIWSASEHDSTSKDGTESFNNLLRSHGTSESCSTNTTRTNFGVASPASTALYSERGTPFVCYGMVDQIKCQHISGPLISSRLVQTGPAERLTELLLQREEHRYVLSLPKEPRPFAHINCKSALVFAEAEKLCGVSFGVFCMNQDLVALQSAASRSHKRAATLCVCVNVSGPRDQGDAIGKMFSQHSMFFQDPSWPADGVEYANPHVIAFEGISGDDIFLNDISRFEEKSGQTYDWNIVLDDLPEHHTKSGFEDNLLAVPLLRHQLDAFDYMKRREIGDLEGMSRFWLLDRSQDGVPIYRHVVTRAERPDCPSETIGGILADDMGLGKTLTTLALIAHSLDRATWFANYHPFSQGKTLPLVRTKATLVVAPSILIMEDWAREIERRVRSGVLRVTKYHGHERVRHFSALLDIDIVLTTYGTIATEHRKIRSREVLYCLQWFRIVLDEAHIIRSQHTKQFQAIMMLNARHHWCLSGTPIANKIDDLGALLQFCRVPLLEDKTTFRQHVTKTAKRSFLRGCEVLRKTLSPICLRRTKALLDLPKPSLEFCMVKLSNSERELYRQVFAHSKRTIETILSGMKTSDKRHTVLHTILQLRRLCNHGSILRPKFEETDDLLEPDEALTLLEENDQAFCAACFCGVSLLNQVEDSSSGLLGTCEHVLCRSCLESDSQVLRSASFHCPVCDVNVRSKAMLNTDQGRQSISTVVEGAHSTKLNALLGNLMKSKDEAKSLVFSVWKTTIDVTSNLCTARGLAHVCIDGTTPQAQRREAIDRFTNDPKVSVMLMTLGTGALGLNLTAASHIHIIEPQWNPSVEEQAIGRAVRIGQENETTIIRYIVEDTVEIQIQGYQKRKIQLAAGGFGESAEAETEAQTRLLTASFLNRVS